MYIHIVSVCYSTKIIILPSKRHMEKNEVIRREFFAALRHEHTNNTGRQYVTCATIHGSVLCSTFAYKPPETFSETFMRCI